MLPRVVEAVSNALAEEFRLLCLDSRSHGMSEEPIAVERYQQAQIWADDCSGSHLDSSRCIDPFLWAGHMGALS